MSVTPANDNETPAKRVEAIDLDIEYVMGQIECCKSLPPDKRALATTRLHYQVKLLEEARWKLAQEAYPDAVKHIRETTFHMPTT